MERGKCGELIVIADLKRYGKQFGLMLSATARVSLCAAMKADCVIDGANEFLKEHRKVQELEANAAKQQKQIEALYCRPPENERAA